MKDMSSGFVAFACDIVACPKAPDQGHLRYLLER